MQPEVIQNKQVRFLELLQKLRIGSFKLGQLCLVKISGRDKVADLVEHLTRLIADGLSEVAFPHTGRSGNDDDLCIFKEDRKSTRLNSSHVAIAYAVFGLNKKR